MKRKQKHLLLVSSGNYQNKRQIKDFLFNLKEKYGEETFKIATLARDYGVSPLVKKYTAEFNIDYGEFNPYHKHRKLFDIMPDRLFNKKYHFLNFVYRDAHAVKWADAVLIFVDRNYDIKKFQGLENIVKEVKKRKKKKKKIIFQIIEG